MGSLLVEAVVGIGLLGVLVGAVAAVLPASLEADIRASAHREAIEHADAVLESVAAGMDPGVLAPPSPAILSIGIVEEGAAHHHPACDVFRPRSAGDLAVHVQHGGRTEGRPVVLTTDLRPWVDSARAVSDGPSTLSVHTGSDLPSDALLVIAPDGSALGATSVAIDCVGFTNVASGRSWVTAAGIEGAATVIDRFHVNLLDRSVPVTLSGRPADLTLDVARAARLTVVAGTGGARSPDHVANGALRWFVRGDEARVGAELGASRSVYPGPVEVVIAACDDAASTGSTGRVITQPDEDALVEVPLAVVTVRDVAGHADASLHVQRTTTCADGTGLRPVLRYEGSIHDGMRIALPRGEWEAWLLGPSNTVLTRSVRFVAVGSDNEVRLS